ncbi:hypothetical protein Scani_03300 [Streptomyces caniferus]|uniref:Uncharacterized protein n=1 Tax=Streptomyces caniferus TaxID=285557 RepID=A0A640S070_9ACTN|nr:hypothetical protein Scani_03300 [Streptomyces caniferus]
MARGLGVRASERGVTARHHGVECALPGLGPGADLVTGEVELGGADEYDGMGEGGRRRGGRGAGEQACRQSAEQRADD